MGWPSFKDLCQKELRLDQAGEQLLKVAARTFLTEWDKKYPEQKNRDEQGAYDSNTLHQIAVTYVQTGWNTATVKLSPGKDLWTGLDIDSGKPVYIYPRDKKFILEGVEKVFAKIQQGQERYQRRARNRAGKRKRDEESENDDESELPDIDDLRKDMTPQSLPKPRRQSDRIKQNTYPTLNFDMDEDFLKFPTNQAQVDEASWKEDQGRQWGSQSTSDSHDSSASEHDEQQVRPSKRLLWPSARSLARHQTASSTPTHSAQKAATLGKISIAQPMNVTRFSTPEMEKSDRDNVSPDKIQPMMQSSVPRTSRRPRYQPDSDDITVYFPPLLNISGPSTRVKAPNATNSANKPGAALIGSKSKHAQKNSRLGVAGQVTSTEQGPIVDITGNKDAPSSKGIDFSQDSVTVIKDPRSPTLAAQSLPPGLDNHSGPNRTDLSRSGTHSPLDIDRLSMPGEGSPSNGGTGKVTVPSESHQDRVIDQPVPVVDQPVRVVDQPVRVVDQPVRVVDQPVRVVDQPIRVVDQPIRVVDQPVRMVGSGRSTYTWILKSSHPLKAWVLWPGVDLIQENLPSVFAAVVEHTDLTEFRSLEITLETPEQSFTFPTSREDLDHFEDMKRFMSNMIEISRRERHVLPSIWISPIGVT